MMTLKKRTTTAKKVELLKKVKTKGMSHRMKEMMLKKAEVFRVMTQRMLSTRQALNSI